MVIFSGNYCYINIAPQTGQAVSVWARQMGQNNRSLFEMGWGTGAMYLGVQCTTSHDAGSFKLDIIYDVVQLCSQLVPTSNTFILCNMVGFLPVHVVAEIWPGQGPAQWTETDGRTS